MRHEPIAHPRLHRRPFVLAGLGAPSPTSRSASAASRYSGPKGFLLYRRLRRDRRPQAARAGGDLRRQGRPGAEHRPRRRLPRPRHAQPRPGAQAADRHHRLDRHRRPARRPLRRRCSPAATSSCSSPATRSSFTESAVILERLIGKLIHNTDVGGGKRRAAERRQRRPRRCGAHRCRCLRCIGLAAAPARRRRCSPAAPARSRRTPTTIRGSRSTARSSGSTTSSTTYVLEPVARGWDYVVPDRCSAASRTSSTTCASRSCW